jgi:polyphosphate kinase
MPTKRRVNNVNYRLPRNFFDRELSWLAFNRRVLEEAQDATVPLLERLKFLGIVQTNLDEFFMVRVSGVQEHIKNGIRRKSHAGLTPMQQFPLVHAEVHAQMREAYACWRDEIVPALARENIQILGRDAIKGKLAKDLLAKFEREIFPVLTPLAVDAGHPFPRLKNLSLNLICHLKGESRSRRNESLIALVQVPSVFPRLVHIPSPRDEVRFVFLEDVITSFISHLFPGIDVEECVPFRITRDADIEYKEIEAEDLLKYIETEIRERERGTAVRLEIADGASPQLESFLTTMLSLSDEQVYRVAGPIALNELSAITKLDGCEHLREEPFTPNIRKPLAGPGSVFSKIRRGDIMLHHPYESFIPVVDFIGEAARDPKVLAIKQTLYRTSGDSPIIDSLIEAAENGKQVAALVELKARFDEENNIVWARRLEEAGVHVVYGLVGLKTHCKAALVVRKEGDVIRRYVHLGTGNYNPTTARLYTDVGMFSCEPQLCDDASELFNMLTGYAQAPEWKRMIVAPYDLRERTLAMIGAEREKAEAGKPARIRAKLNSIVDMEVITELYRASCAGVQIDLCVRGVCCLKPGVAGLSENIRVWSIVDRFLEHSRIYMFGEDPAPLVFFSSADWMDRNMDRRIEVMFPVTDAEAIRRSIRIFSYTTRDNVKARHLQPDGRYSRAHRKPGEAMFRAQEQFLVLEETIASQEKPSKQLAGLPVPNAPAMDTPSPRVAPAPKARRADKSKSDDLIPLPGKVPAPPRVSEDVAAAGQELKELKAS